MGTDLNSNILGAKRASELTKTTGNLSSIYSKTECKQKEALSELFSQKYFNSTTEKATIDKQIKALEEKIEELEKKIDKIKDQIEGKESELSKVQTDIADKVAKIARETDSYEDSSRSRIDEAISLAQDHYRNDSHSKRNGGERTLADFVIEQMGLATSYITSGRVGIDNAIEELGTPQSELSNLVKDMEGLTDGIDTLNSQYGTTKSTLELLKLTRNNMSDAAKGYQTSDTDPSVPIFTPEKEDLADGYLAKYNSRMAGRENEKTTTSAADKQAVKDKYSKNIANQTAGADPYSMNNAQLKSFSEALNSGMLKDMEGAGFTKKEVLDSIKEMFPSIGISHGDDGRPVVPYGHGSDGQAKGIYTNFIDQFGKMEGGAQRDDKQVAEMDKAIKNDKIITEMKNNDFSWKECGYTITRLWPGAGIGFNLGEKEITIPNGDDKSKGTYDALAEQIKKNYPDVKINRGTGDETVKDDPKRTDPVGFHIGDDSYDFVIDRDKDGVIDSSKELVGANGTCGIEEMKLFDTDGDGHITGDELNNVLLLNADHGKEMNYEFLTAAQLGIKDIDLSSFEKKEQGRPDGQGGEDFININNSLITGTFDVKMKDGTTAEGYQKYVTEDYMKAVYDPMFGENIYSQLDGKKVDNIIDKNFAEADKELADINEFAQLVDAAKGYTDIKRALRTKLNNATNEANSYRIQQTSQNISGYNEKEDNIELEMDLGRAEDLIQDYIDEADKKKKDEDK